MTKLGIITLFFSLLQLSVPLFAADGGQSMSDSEFKPAEISIQIENTNNTADTFEKQKLEQIAQDLIKSLFPDDLLRSSKIFGKISLIGADGKIHIFETNCLFLYRKTYTAVSHKIVFGISDSRHVVLSIDGVKQQGLP